MTQQDGEGPIERGGTIVRPKPRSALPRPELTPPPPFPPPQSAEGAARQRAAGRPGVITTYNLAGSGLNPLVRAAGPLLLMAGRLRRTAAAIDCAVLRTKLAADVNTFDQRLLRSGVPADQAEAARYALCATLDEAVLGTPWGASSGWSARPLLLRFHGESTGGEKFFQWVDRMVSDPRSYAGLLEVYYQCLSLGFEGNSAYQSHNRQTPEDIRRRLFGHLRALKGETSKSLSRHWQGARRERARGLAALWLWINAAAESLHLRNSTSRESVNLEQRFLNAVARLAKSRADERRIRSLPWWVVFGTPGSGKTTLVARSELSFVAAEARDDSPGCNWWFTNDAVLFDIPGRTDWSELLPFLKHHRRRIQGALITLSASDQLKQTGENRDALLLETRRQMNELNRTLGRSLPVYLLMTKMDLLMGFREYFADLDALDRSQVWGVTFTLADCRSGRAVNTLSAEFDALIGQVHDGLAQRLRDEGDLRKRSILFEFPQQMAALKPGLIDLVSRFDQVPDAGKRPFLRGAYFTSGGGPGNPVDAVLSSVDSPPVSADVSERTFFTGQLLSDVVLCEAGLSL